MGVVCAVSEVHTSKNVATLYFCKKPTPSGSADHTDYRARSLGSKESHVRQARLCDSGDWPCELSELSLSP